jgi:predicted chitinase
MANTDKELQQSFEQTIQTNRTANRELSSAVKNVVKFSDALEEASNTAIDKAVASLKDLLSKTNLLTDAQVDSIKNAKQATSTLSALAKKQARLSEMLDDYNHQMKDIVKRGKAKSVQDQDIVKINERYIAGLHKMGIHTANNADVTQTINEQLSKHVKVQKEVSNQTEKVSTIQSKFGKAMVGNTESFIDNTKRLYSWTVVMNQAKKAVRELYGSAVELSNKGMLMSMRAQMEGAIRLRITMDEFQKLVTENMDMIASLGGGVGGIDRFTKEVEFASQGLEHMGKLAAFYGMKNAKVLMKAGMGPNSQGGMDVLYRKSLMSMNAQFKLFQAGFGDTIEEFAGYYDSVLQAEDIQSKMNTLDEAGKNKMMEEIDTRTKNIRVMGLSLKGMEQMNQRMDDMFNPGKNNQSERMKQFAMSNNAFASVQSALSPEDQKRMQDLMPFFQSINQMKLNNDTQGYKNAQGSKEYQQLSELFYKGRTTQFERSRKSGMAGVDLYAANEMVGGSEMYTKDLMEMGEASATKGRSGVPNKIGSPAVDAWIDQTQKMTGEGDLLTKAFNFLRTAVEQYQSIISNPLGMLASTILITTLINKFGGGLANLVKSVVSGGNLFKMAAGGVMRGVMMIIKGIPVLGSIYAAMEAGWGSVMGTGTSTSDYYARAGIDEQATFVPQFMKDIGVRSLGVLTDVGSAAAGMIGIDMTKNFADKQLKTSSSNEATMLQALVSNGVTDPKQQAMLMGQFSHETGGFKNMTEIGNGSRYEGSKTLGNTQAGDGEKYKGRGYVQLTGRDNYKRAGEALGYDLINHPELAAQPDIAAKIAWWYTSTKKVGGESVVGMAGRGDIMGVTTAINGGTNGLQSRINATQSYMAQLYGGGAAGAPGTSVAAMTGAVDSDGLPIVPSTPSSTSGAPTDPVSELQKQTAILLTIATNTMPSKGVDPRVYRRPQDAVVAGS